MLVVQARLRGRKARLNNLPSRADMEQSACQKAWNLRGRGAREHGMGSARELQSNLLLRFVSESGRRAAGQADRQTDKRQSCEDGGAPGLDWTVVSVV